MSVKFEWEIIWIDYKTYLLIGWSYNKKYKYLYFMQSQQQQQHEGNNNKNSPTN